MVSVNGRQMQSIDFDTETKGAINFDNLAAMLPPGNHVVTLQMVGGSKMPYSFNAKYFAETPASSADCPLWLETKLAKDEVSEGEVVEVQVKVKNLSKDGQAMSMAIVGIPAGLEVRHDKLKELVEAGRIAFYEVLGRDLALYFREFAPNAEVSLSLDCVAEIPGQYTGPASRAYLYYGDEHKNWRDGLFVKINPRQ
ncbi:MAG: hypothetical protein KDB07_12900 [Planctomycetes bacterium]|nr:hypothetical protein [Planctomycetota bacterium]